MRIGRRRGIRDMARVGIIVEEEKEYKRVNFWPAAINRFEDDLKNTIEKINITPNNFALIEQRCDILIVKWDAANGDGRFGSSEVLRQIKYNKNGIEDFVKNGGVLIIECQSHHGIPRQVAYNGILKPFGFVRVSDDEVQRLGFYVRRKDLPYSKQKGQRKYSPEVDNPLLKYLPEKIFPSPDIDTVSKPWFTPKEKVAPWVLDRTYPGKVYSGWFISFSKEWKPLLYDEEGIHPVMIWLPHGKGAVIASTMYLASSFIPQLIRNILKDDFKQKMMEYVEHVHRNSREAKRYLTGAATSVIAEIILTIIIYGLANPSLIPWNYLLVIILTFSLVEVPLFILAYIHRYK
jgi:hypothetical protein